MPLIASTVNSSTGVVTNACVLAAITLMAFNSTSVLSKHATKMYHGTGSFIEVVQNQLGDTVRFIFNFCVLVQQIVLPLIYLLVIVYELNHLIFGSSTKGEAKSTLYSLCILAVPACGLSLVSYGKTVMYAGMLNTGAFLFTAAVLCIFAVVRLLPAIRRLSIDHGSL